MTFTTDELNYLVYRYLDESGYTHSAYTFGLESGVVASGVSTVVIPPAALLSLVQKGIQLQTIFILDWCKLSDYLRISLVTKEVFSSPVKRPKKTENKSDSHLRPGLL